MKDLHKFWKHRWITSKSKVYKSYIHGLGVIAVENIPKGEVVAVLGGVIVPISEINKYREKFGHIGIQIDDNFFICPASREELKETGAFNHSCEPNIGYKDPITFVTIRDIKADEELVFDYAFSESMFEPFECNCGNADCRKIIKPDDWKIPEIQKRHGEYFSPYLKKKFFR